MSASTNEGGTQVPLLARAMAQALTVEIVSTGRSAVVLLASGYPRELIDITIDAAERLVLQFRGEQVL
ncbi:hypothetical protein BN1110_06316 [bacterium YEK0313]|nr:hypothetical protein BN1110_06316 [bacterium YEK0313]